MIKWTEEELNFLRENNSKMTHKEISEILGKTKSAVQLKANRLGLTKSKYTYNENFFQEIDTEEKAYWLGFIYADGYVVNNEKNGTYEVAIELQYNDFNHLKKFNKSLKGNIEVKQREKVCNLNGKIYKMCQIRMYSKKMVKDLELFGVMQNKTKQLDKIPNIPKELIHHFIRGYFDGDGCVCLDKQHNHPKADFTCGSLNFLEDIKKWLNSNDIGGYTFQEKSGTYRLFIRGMKNFDKFFNLLYKDYTICLDRKLKKKNSIYRECKVAQRLPR